MHSNKLTVHLNEMLMCSSDLFQITCVACAATCSFNDYFFRKFELIFSRIHMNLNFSGILSMDKFLMRGNESEDDATLLVNSISQISADAFFITQKLHSNNDHFDVIYYKQILPKKLADRLLIYCEKNIKYFTGNLARVFLFNQWHQIPRKQIAMGHPNLHYRFSGNVIPAKPWNAVILALRNLVSEIAKCDFNFVLINRYKDGHDYIGEHRDNEKELDPSSPIASVTVGEKRDFIFKHYRVNHQPASASEKVCIALEHGSMLLISADTNRHWSHSLPKRRHCQNVRINFTFRKMKLQLNEEDKD
ncbi:Alpha-ketoglutarate-dependent dioxygenase alkB -like protein 2 [Trichinella patagoniensis]|uniref:DNA oxidative demethylase ALKBH2 n=1 Tax=Trichinella patagoniensis TaxID=990121 RepID=A0A0V0ZC92_9BILA|nr:Alpha-ketoglutarate-dependent dioxygenase alkB -like protein 2 [Trichinella patagoniensis]